MLPELSRNLLISRPLKSRREAEKSHQRHSRGLCRLIGPVYYSASDVNGFAGQEAFLAYNGNCFYELTGLHR